MLYCCFCCCFRGKYLQCVQWTIYGLLMMRDRNRMISSSLSVSPRRRTVALENLRSNCIVRDSWGAFATVLTFVIYISFTSPGETISIGATTTYFIPYTLVLQDNSLRDYILSLLFEVSHHDDDFECADTLCSV